MFFVKRMQDLGDYMWVAVDHLGRANVVWADTRGLGGTVEEDIYFTRVPSSCVEKQKATATGRSPYGRFSLWCALQALPMIPMRTQSGDGNWSGLRVQERIQTGERRCADRCDRCGQAQFAE